MFFLKTEQTAAPGEVENTRDRILRVAKGLIARQGIQKTSLAAIAREAGISRGTLFYYYPRKQSLLYQVMKESFREVTDKIVDMISSMNDGSETKAADVFQIVLQSIGESRELNQINFHLFQEAVTRDKILKKHFIESYREWQDLIAYHLQNIFPQSVAHYRRNTLARLVLALIDGLSMQALLNCEPLEYRETAGILAGLFTADEKAGDKQIILKGMMG